VDSEEVSNASNAAQAASAVARRRSGAGERARLRDEDTEESFREYSRHLLGTLDTERGLDGMASPGSVPLSPSKVDMPSRLLSPINGVDVRKSGESSRGPESTLGIPDGQGPRKLRQGSFVKGDDELLSVGEEGGSGQAVEVLSRHSTKSKCCQTSWRRSTDRQRRMTLPKKARSSLF